MGEGEGREGGGGVLLAKVLHGEGGGKEKGRSAGGGNTAWGRERVGKEGGGGLLLEGCC